MEAVGWAGSALLSACGLPQAIKSMRDGKTVGLSHLFLWLWLAGEALTLAYVASSIDSLPLLVNYFANMIAVTVVLYFLYFPRENSDV